MDCVGQDIIHPMSILNGLGFSINDAVGRCRWGTRTRAVFLYPNPFLGASTRRLAVNRWNERCKKTTSS